MIPTIPTFALRYPPVSGESFIGYVLRLLHIHGHHQLRDLIQIFERKIYKTSFVIGSQECNEFMSFFAPSVQMEIDRLESYFKPHLRTYLESRNIQDINVYTPKFCPLCIQEKPYFQDSWQQLNITHCTTHNLILIDQCPHCSSFFVDWYVFLFYGCPYCGCKWKSFQFPTVQLPMNQLVTFSPEQLDSLFDTMLFTLRPKDLMFRRLQGIELSVAETARQIQIAYELMTNSQLRHEWIERVEASNPYHFTPSIEGRTVKDIFERNSQNFQQQKHCHTACIDIAIPSLTSHLTHRRNKFQKRGIPYQHHLGINEVSFILGISTTDVMQLVEDQLMQPLDATAILRDLFFNVEDITRLLDDINEHAHLIEYDNGLKKLIDFLPMLRFFGMSQGKFLSILSSLAGTYYRTERKQHWLSLFINYENMIYTLENRYLDLLPEHVDKKDFQSIYGLSNEQMQNLMKNSDLHYSNWQRTKQCIKKNVIKDFCSSFIILNRIAKLKCKNVHVFAKELAESGIYPVQILKGTRDVFLYSIYDKDNIFSNS